MSRKQFHLKAWVGIFPQVGNDYSSITYLCLIPRELFNRHAGGLASPNIGFNNAIEVVFSSENDSLVILLVAKLFFHFSYLVVP